MRYTDNRRYPYPEDALEAGHGGLHSELLARAVDADLVALNTAWAAATVQDSIVNELQLGDSSAISVGSEVPIFTDTTTSYTGSRITANTQLVTVPAGQGAWLRITGHIRSKATGTITGGARHRIGLLHYRANNVGDLVLVKARYADTFQAGSADIWNQVTGVFEMRDNNDQVYMTLSHTNTGSTVVAVGSGTFGTRLEAKRLRRL